MSDIEYDEFREDVHRSDGSLVQGNVLFIRGRRGNVEFQIPIWIEDGYAEGYDAKQDARDAIALAIERFEHESS